MNKNKQKRKLQPKLHIKKGDVVKVIAGNDKGKQGRVLSVLIHKNRAFVEGVNIISRHTKPNAKDTKGGIVKKESAIHVSNLMLIDPSSGKHTKIGRKIENDKLVRYSKTSGQIIK